MILFMIKLTKVNNKHVFVFFKNQLLTGFANPGDPGGPGGPGGPGTLATDDKRSQRIRKEETGETVC